MKPLFMLIIGMLSLLVTACEVEVDSDNPEPPVTTREIRDQTLQGSVLNAAWEFESGQLFEEEDGNLRIELFSEAITICEPWWMRANEAVLVLSIDSIDKTYTNREPNLNVLARDAQGAITLIPSDVVLAMRGTREGLIVGGLAVTMENDVNLNGQFALVDCRTF